MRHWLRGGAQSSVSAGSRGVSGSDVENRPWFSTLGTTSVDTLSNEGIRGDTMAHSAATETRGAEHPSGGHQRRGALGTNGKKHAEAVVTATAGLEEPIRERLESALQHDDFEVLVRSLVTVARRKSPTEVESLKAYIFHRLRELQDEASDRRRIWLWTRMAAARPEIEVREMACALLDDFWRDHRKEVERLTLNLARDEDREVRQYAAGTMARNRSRQLPPAVPVSAEVVRQPGSVGSAPGGHFDRGRRGSEAS